MASLEDLRRYTQNPNVRQFLDVVAQAEGTAKNGYNTAFGGGYIESLADHPRQLHDFRQTDGKANKTSAAGRYQFLQGTWDDVAGKLGLTDFGPESQDIAAIELLRRNGALPALLEGDFNTAVQRSGSTWASLPSSPYAQPKRSEGFIASALDKAASSLFPSAQAATPTGPWAKYGQPSQAEAPQAGPWSKYGSQSPAEAPAVSGPLREVPGAEAPSQVEPSAVDRLSSMAEGVFMGLRDPVDAGAQMLRRAVPESIGGAIDSVGNALSDLGLPVARSSGVEGVDAIVNEANQSYEAGRSEGGRSGFDVPRLAGNVASALPVLGTGPSMAGAGLGVRMGVGAAQGGALGGLSPVIGEDAQADFGGQKTRQAMLGAALGGATPAVMSGLSRVISPRASQAGSPAQLLRQEGVTLTPGQTLGGIPMRVEDRAMSLPIMGDAIRSARGRANEQLNRAVYNRVLEPIGKSTTKVGREAVEEASKMVSQAYDDVLAKVSFSADDAFLADISRLTSMAGELPRRESQQFQRLLQRDVLDPLAKGRAVDGLTFKRIEAQLGEQASKFLKTTDAYQQDVGRALLEVQRSLRESLARMNPTQATQLRAVNESFANLVRLQTAAGKIGAQEGVFTPQQLSQAIRQADRTTRKNAYASGRALMQDLSDAAQSRMSAKIPDSGTAERTMAAVLAGGVGYMGAPAVPAALAAGSLPYLPGLVRGASALAGNRPASAKALADALRKLPPGALGILAQ